MDSHSHIQRAKELISRQGMLTSIDMAASWCSDAEATVANLAQEITDAQRQLADLGRQLLNQREDAKKKSLLGYVFRSPEEKRTQAETAKLRNSVASCHSLAEQLQARIDVTPASREQQAQFLKELKAERKELQLHKKEINAAMRNIRVAARQSSTSAATALTTLLVGQKYTAAERRTIRYVKERALAPHEDARAALDRQIMAIEKEILRVEAFR